MKQTKDNFSTLAKGYQRFRPDYPETLYTHLYTHCQGFEHAQDCGTGNGQVALALNQRFEQVKATDISQAQIAAAPAAANIE